MSIAVNVIEPRLLDISGGRGRATAMSVNLWVSLRNGGLFVA